MVASPFGPTCRAGGQKHSYRWRTAQLDVFERQCRHSGDVLPAGDRRGRLPTPLAHASIGRNAVELMRKRGQRQRFERGTMWIADELQDAVVNRMNGPLLSRTVQLA